jgi:cell wall-associated NlpC family hydrolase
MAFTAVTCENTTSIGGGTEMRTGAAVGVATTGVMALLLGVAVFAGSEEDDQMATAGAALDAKKVPAKYRVWVERAGKKCAAVSAPLIAAQIEAESQWNRTAESPVGARGLSQFMPGTWTIHGVDGDGDGDEDPLSPPDAIMSQAAYDCYLAELVDGYGAAGDPTELMLAAYNAGPGAVQQYRGIPPYPETRQYVARITGLTAKYTAADAAPGAGFGGKVATAAESQLGVPYSWGGGGPSGPSRGTAQGAGTVGFDCSSLVQYAVHRASGGKTTLPRITQDQVNAGQRVPRDRIRPGDAVFFSLNGSTDHVGIATAPDRMVHAPRTGSVVRHEDLTDPYWSSRIVQVRRYR